MPGRQLLARGCSTVTVLLSSTSSDSHTWNLVFLELLINEMGHDVINLGPCVPDQVLLDECNLHRPDLVVLSSVNGHGYRDGLRIVRRLRSCDHLRSTPIVIGGKLGVAGRRDQHGAGSLLNAGFDAVFEGESAVSGFRSFVGSLPMRAPAPC